MNTISLHRDGVSWSVLSITFAQILCGLTVAALGIRLLSSKSWPANRTQRVSWGLVAGGTLLTAVSFICDALYGVKLGYVVAHVGLIVRLIHKIRFRNFRRAHKNPPL